MGLSLGFSGIPHPSYPRLQAAKDGGFAFSFSRRVVLRHSASERERQQACCQ